MLNPHQIRNRIAVTTGVIVLAATLLPSAVARPIPDDGELIERGYGGSVTAPSKAINARPTALNAPHVIGFDSRYGSYAKVAGAGRFIDN